MKRLDWRVQVGLLLVALSAVFYLVHYAIFRDAHHIWIYLVGDVAFLPAEVLVVTLIIHNLLDEREKRRMLKKLNMVIGAFFSEVGTELMRRLESFDPAAGEVAQHLVVESGWGDAQFEVSRRYVAARESALDPKRGDLAGLRHFLAERRGFLLTLLENPNLLEHESFTDVLWAVFHLTEELMARRNLSASTDSDLRHLAGDIRRAHTRLVLEWLDYMRHLRDDYPYLFSLAARTNPFDPSASPEVTA